MLNAECPPAEELASLLEGRSGFRARRKLLVHLNTCEPCFQVFSAAAEFQADFPEHALSPPRRARHPFLLWVVAAVLLLSAAGTGFLLWRASSVERGGMPLAEVVELLPAGSLSDELWPAVSVQFRSEHRDDRKQTAFEIGVLMVGLAVNLEERRLDDARHRQGVAIEALASVDAASRSRGELAAAAPDLPAIDEALGRELDSVYYTLGKWAEAGRLAARRDDAGFLTSESFRGVERFLRNAKLPDEIQKELDAVRQLTEARPTGEAELARLEDSLTKILLTSSRS
ncbi:MAG: hypothetical protein ACRD3V_29940 [Vicinamibacteria bacterium]